MGLDLSNARNPSFIISKTMASWLTKTLKQWDASIPLGENGQLKGEIQKMIKDLKKYKQSDEILPLLKERDRKKLVQSIKDFLFIHD